MEELKKLSVFTEDLAIVFYQSEKQLSFWPVNEN